MKDVLAGLPPDVLAALEAAPEDDWRLLELRLAWPGLEDAEARVAEALRVFVLSRDPLDWLEPRAPAWAATTGDGDAYEVLLYVTYGNLVELAELDGCGAAHVLAALAESCVTVAARHESLLAADAYPRLVFDGAVPALLSEPVADLPGARGAPRLPEPAIALAAGGWEPVGLGAVQDLVQDALGPVDLDRSPVRLPPRDRPHPGCPACAGRSFGFVADLEEHRPGMCQAHARQAERERDARLRRAAESNPDGWDAISRACLRLDQAPGGPPRDLLRRLRQAVDRPEEAWPLHGQPPAAAFVEQARTDAELVLQLTGWLAECGESLTDVTGDDLHSAMRADDWLMNLPHRVARAGLVDLAVAVGDALAGADPDNRSLYAADVAVLLAEAGRGEQAVARAEANVAAFPADVWARVHLGDVHVRLGDAERAEEQYRLAVEAAETDGDPSEVSDAYERLAGFLRDSPGRQADARAAEEARRQWERETGRRGHTRSALPGDSAEEEADLPPLVKPAPVRRAGPKVGRNDPCPCGSGRKYKRCCGQ